ncbi:MAG: VanZ family protein [Lachnospiraceae bacterium]|nr:VanZ family protein [Lachnospiraceae bacterium]
MRKDKLTNLNFVPFRSIGNQVVHIFQGWALINLLGNIIPFIPFGFLLPISYRKINTFYKVFAVGFLSIIIIELFQFITKLGSLDVDDIILNTVGVSLGYFMIRLFNCIFITKREISICRTVETFS